MSYSFWPTYRHRQHTYKICCLFMPRCSRTRPLEPAGEHRWIVAPGWLCEQHPSGGWAALPPEDNQPPLFAPSLESLAWVVTQWDRYISRRISYSVANAMRKHRATEGTTDPTDDRINRLIDELRNEVSSTAVASAVEVSALAPAVSPLEVDQPAALSPAQRALARRRARKAQLQPA